MTSLAITTIGPSRPTTTARIETPDGTMFVHIIEENNKPAEIKLNIGKVGSPLMAWADCTSRLATLLLQTGTPLETILAELSGIHSDKLVYSGGISIQSGPDGLAQAIILYRKSKITEQYEKGEIDFRPPFIKREKDGND